MERMEGMEVMECMEDMEGMEDITSSQLCNLGESSKTHPYREFSNPTTPHQIQASFLLIYVYIWVIDQNRAAVSVEFEGG